MYTTGKRTITTSRESKDGSVRVQVGIECNVQELEAIVDMIAAGHVQHSPNSAWAEEILAILGGSEHSKTAELATAWNNGAE